MVDDVLAYDYLNDDVPESKAMSTVTGLSDLVDAQEPKSIFEENYIVLDQKKVPQNTIESIEKKMVKINRKLK